MRASPSAKSRLITRGRFLASDLAGKGLAGKGMVLIDAMLIDTMLIDANAIGGRIHGVSAL